VSVSEQVFNIHEELINRCLAGDQEAHYKLYKLYSRAMYNVGYRITGNEEDAEDVLQESFVSAFRNLSSYRADASFGSWIKRIVVNKAINVLKKRKFEMMPEDREIDFAEESDPEEYLPMLSVERVKQAIEQLPDGYRSVLSLYLLEGYDHQEISEIMGISESTSKSQLNRAKNKLKELLTTEMNRV
jgi:RNA polymerase sigma factor (sigma-70 family)